MTHRHVPSLKKDSELPWQFGRYALLGSLLAFHVWGTMLILSYMAGKPEAVNMFSAISNGIIWNLAILVAGKGWKDFSPNVADVIKKGKNASAAD